MNLNYSLNQNDFLQYQLFTASKNKTLIKQKRRSLLWIFLATIIIGINIYNSTKNGLLYFIPVCLIILPAFYFLIKWQYKSHYLKYIQQNYKEKIGFVSDFNFKNDELIVINSMAESKIHYSSFSEINEIQDYYFLKIKTGESFIIPKSVISKRHEFEQIILLLKEKYNIKEVVELNWKY